MRARIGRLLRWFLEVAEERVTVEIDVTPPDGCPEWLARDIRACSAASEDRRHGQEAPK